VKPEKGVCSSCGANRWYAHKAKKLCKYCNEKRKASEKKARGKKPYAYKRKPTGERDVFIEIWNERPHECEHCGKPLNEPLVHYFAHIKPKRTHPELRLKKSNIRILCYDFTNGEDGCHWCFDHGTPEQFEARKDKYR